MFGGCEFLMLRSCEIWWVGVFDGVGRDGGGWGAVGWEGKRYSRVKKKK